MPDPLTLHHRQGRGVTLDIFKFTTYIFQGKSSGSNNESFFHLYISFHDNVDIFKMSRSPLNCWNDSPPTELFGCFTLCILPLPLRNPMSHVLSHVIAIQKPLLPVTNALSAHVIESNLRVKRDIKSPYKSMSTSSMYS